MLLPILIGVAAVVLAVAAAVLFLRARAREHASGNADALTADSLGEMRAIGQRIETLVSQQQLQGETARQHLAQKLDAVGENIDQQRTHLSGLQNELRHEVHRRDAEMDEIRTQLASIQHATALDGAAAPRHLPPAQAEAASPYTSDDDAVFPQTNAPFGAPVRLDVTEEASFADEGPAEPYAPEVPTLPEVHSGDGLASSFDEMPFSDGWDTGAPATEASGTDLPSTEAPAPDAFPSSETAPSFTDPFAFIDPFAVSGPPQEVDADEETTSDFEPFDFQPPADSDDSLGSLFEDLSFGGPAEPAFESLTPLPAPSAPAPTVQPPLAPPSDSAWIARSTRTAEDAPAQQPAAPAVLVTPPPAPSTPPAFAPPVLVEAPPEGAEDLTVVSTIDATIQDALYAAGVLTLDEIARWGRADARRIASIASVSEDTIMNQWIFEAQAALFQSFSTRK